MRLRGNPKLKALDRRVLGTAIRLVGSFKTRAALQLPPQSILLVKLNALGDTLLFLSLARVLKRHYPSANIDFLGSEINWPVVERCPHLRRAHCLELSKLVRRPAYGYAFFKQIRRARYDIVIDGSQWERITALITLLAGAKTTIGFDTPGHRDRAAAFHFPILHRRDAHEIDCFHWLLEPLGIKPDVADRRGEYWVGQEDRDELRRISLPPEPWIVFHPGCGAHGAPRQWPVGHYVRLAELLRERWPDHSILISGGPEEEELGRQINSGAPEATYDLSGRLDFALLGAVLEKAALIVCGNTGVMHLGAALGTPLVAMHGPTDPRKWGPLSDRAVIIQSEKSCVPCLYLGYEYNCQCPDCMDEITVEEVFQACSDILDRRSVEAASGA